MKAAYHLVRMSLDRVLALSLRNQNTQTWARNSILTDAFQPFRSDLDLTLLSDNLSPQQAKTVRALLKVTKLAFPALGEMNLYSRKNLSLHAQLLNPWELDRDPQLKQHLSSCLPKTSARASAFILRMLENDLHNLQSRPASRKKKWDRHFHAIAQDFPETAEVGFAYQPHQAIASILRLVLWLAGIQSPPMIRDALSWLEFFFELQHAEVADCRQTLLLEVRPWQWAFFPHRFCFHSSPLPTLGLELSQVFAAQLEWELNGILTQYPNHVSLESGDSSWTHLKDIESLSTAASRAFDPTSVRDLPRLTRDVTQIIVAHLDPHDPHMVKIEGRG
jgi:hypothetical protein